MGAVYGCQPISRKFISECARLDIEQIFTAYSNPKGNADTERMFRTIKEELIWINEFKDVWEIKKEIEKWVINIITSIYTPHYGGNLLRNSKTKLS